MYVGGCVRIAFYMNVRGVHLITLIGMQKLKYLGGHAGIITAAGVENIISHRRN